jgi:hypothetical protein
MPIFAAVRAVCRLLPRRDPVSSTDKIDSRNVASHVRDLLAVVRISSPDIALPLELSHDAVQCCELCYARRRS